MRFEYPAEFDGHNDEKDYEPDVVLPADLEGHPEPDDEFLAECEGCGAELIHPDQDSASDLENQGFYFYDGKEQKILCGSCISKAQREEERQSQIDHAEAQRWEYEQDLE